MSDPKITVIAQTARDFHPWPSRPDWTVFDPVCLSLEQQDDPPPFELIYVDVRHGEVGRGPVPRRSFRARHIPPRANPWHPIGLPATGAQFNTGLIHACGEVVVSVADSCMFPPWYLRRVWEEYQRGWIPVPWYLYDLTFAPSVVPPPRDMPPPYDKEQVSPARYDILGHIGTRVYVDHRYIEMCKASLYGGGEIGHWDRLVPWQWFFGYCTLPIDAAERINGHDENFDGQVDLGDVDRGSRLDLAGYGDRFRMFSDIFLVEVFHDWTQWGGPIQRALDNHVRCNYGLLLHRRHTRDYVANKGVPVKVLENDIHEKVCCVGDRHREDGSHTALTADCCPIITGCRLRGMYPFGPREGREHLYKRWCNMVPMFDLANERKAISRDAP